MVTGHVSQNIISHTQNCTNSKRDAWVQLNFYIFNISVNLLYLIRDVTLFTSSLAKWQTAPTSCSNINTPLPVLDVIQRDSFPKFMDIFLPDLCFLLPCTLLDLSAFHWLFLFFLTFDDQHFPVLIPCVSSLLHPYSYFR